MEDDYLMEKKHLVAAVAFCLFASLPVMALAADPKIVENDKQVKATKEGITPSSIGGGVISCSDGGGRILYCPWTYTSSSPIIYSNLYVEFSDYWLQGFNYPVPSFKTIRNVAEDPVKAPGYYFAILQGEITTIDGVWIVKAAKSASAYVN